MNFSKVIALIAVFLMFSHLTNGQSTTLFPSDTLSRTIIELQNEVYDIQLNLYKAQRDMKLGILVATIGYSVTILGGQLLGTNPDLGETLLYVGGATGITGTVFLVRGFKKFSLGPPRKPANYPMY